MNKLGDNDITRLPSWVCTALIRLALNGNWKQNSLTLWPNLIERIVHTRGSARKSDPILRFLCSLHTHLSQTEIKKTILANASLSTNSLNQSSFHEKTICNQAVAILSWLDTKLNNIGWKEQTKKPTATLKQKLIKAVIIQTLDLRIR